MLFTSGPRWYTRLFGLAVILLPVALLGLLFLKDRLSIGLGTIANEGDVLLPDLGRYGWPVVILAGVGLVTALWRGQDTDRLAALFCGLVALEGFGFWFLKTFLEQGSYYSLYKLFYPAAYLFPVLAALGINFLAGLVWKREIRTGSVIPKLVFPALAVILFGLCLVPTWAANPRPERPYPVITADNLKVARWMKQNLEINEFSVAYNVRPGTPGYWLQVGLFKLPRGVRSNDVLYLPPPTFESWFYSPDSQKYLFTDDLQRVNLDERVQVLYQSGSAAVLTRTPAYTRQLGQRPNLTLTYRAEHYKNALMFTSETTMSQEPTEWLSVGVEIEKAEGGSVLFKGYVPAEKGRLRKQFLGITVRFPAFQVLEFYSNNNFPPKPDPVPAMPPAKYSAYLVLQKHGTTIERRKLNDFTLLNSGEIAVEEGQRVVQGQYVFEGSLPQDEKPGELAAFQINGEDIKLVGLDLPAKTGANQTAQLELKWLLPTGTTRNYRFRLVWLDESGKAVAEYEAQPLNGLYPTWMWPAGKTVTIRQGLKAPEKAGQYRLAVGLVEGSTKSELKALDKFLEVS
jgi:hypothetical protein